MARLLFDITGQSLIWDCPEGRPSSVTSVTVYPSEYGDDGTPEPATTGNASIEANPDTTFDAVSGSSQANPNVANLAATTGIEIGRTYLATATDSSREWVEVVAVNSGASVETRHPLANAYISGDTFESTRISIAIDDTWIADETNISDDLDPNPGYRVRWVYVVGGVTYVHNDHFDVVRYRAEHDVEGGSIAERDSMWLEKLPIEHKHDNGQRLIEKAYATLGFDLHRLGIPQEMLRNRAVVNELTELKTLMMTYSDRAKQTGDTIPYEIARDEYQAALDGLVASGKTEQSLDTSGSGERRQAISLWSK